MPREVRQTPAARRDLIEIWEFTARGSGLERADALLESIVSTYERIAEFPQIGRERPELAIGLRSYVAGSYVIFYVLLEAVEVIRVLRAERDIEVVLSRTLR